MVVRFTSGLGSSVSRFYNVSHGLLSERRVGRGCCCGFGANVISAGVGSVSYIVGAMLRCSGLSALLLLGGGISVGVETLLRCCKAGIVEGRF